MITGLAAFPVYVVLSNLLILANRVLHNKDGGLDYYLIGSVCNSTPLTDDAGWFLSFLLLKLLVLSVLLFMVRKDRPLYKNIRWLVLSFFIMDIYSGLTFYSDQLFATSASPYFFSSALLLNASHIYFNSYIAIPVISFIMGNILLFRYSGDLRFVLRLNLFVLISAVLSCLALYGLLLMK
jgi:membrane-associated HD superfamily phosphohydrolase